MFDHEARVPRRAFRSPINPPIRNDLFVLSLGANMAETVPLAGARFLPKSHHIISARNSQDGASRRPTDTPNGRREENLLELALFARRRRKLPHYNLFVLSFKQMIESVRLPFHYMNKALPASRSRSSILWSWHTETRQHLGPSQCAPRAV